MWSRRNLRHSTAFFMNSPSKCVLEWRKDHGSSKSTFQMQDCLCSMKVCHKFLGEELKASKHNCQEKEKERDPLTRQSWLQLRWKKHEARWAKMQARLRTRDQKRVLHNRTAVEKGLHMFPPFKSMDEWTMKCLLCERDIDLWTWSGQKKVFNLTARLE